MIILKEERIIYCDEPKKAASAVIVACWAESQNWILTAQKQKRGRGMKKLLVAAAVLVLFLAGDVFAYDQNYGWDSKDMFSKKAMFILSNQDELGLSDAQVEEINNLKLGVKKDMIKKEADIEVLELDIESALLKDAPDITAVNALIDQKYELKKAKTKVSIESCAALKGILTSEQKTKLKSLNKACKKNMMKHGSMMQDKGRMKSPMMGQ